MQKELRGLAEEDEELKQLRRRWNLATTQEGNWWKDIQDSMARWSVFRTRVEEEISRRIEAARYAAPHSHVYSATLNVLTKEGEDPDPLRPVSISPASDKSAPGAQYNTIDASAESRPQAAYAVSPYCRHKITPAHPPVPREPGELFEESLRDLNRVHAALDESGCPVSLAALRGGLMPPPARSGAECRQRLPKPGSFFGSFAEGAPGAARRKSPRRKSSRKSARGRKSKSPKRR
mmetsp:Transcript_2258/g.5333  ORF Transcript_2258/g.5333 Transcript_2258/m.5333 type:complete len:235 (-) Transcript_2258:187-891(-)